jgi:hypothetical protein
MFEARPSAIDDGIERRDVMSAASIVGRFAATPRVGHLCRSPARVGDRMDANSTGRFHRINYDALTISAPHRITTIEVVRARTNPREEARGTIRPC